MNFIRIKKCVSTLCLLLGTILVSHFVRASQEPLELPKTTRQPIILGVKEIPDTMTPASNIFTEWKKQGRKGELPVCPREDSEDDIVNVPTFENDIPADNKTVNAPPLDSKIPEDEPGLASKYKVGKVVIPVLSLASLVFEFSRAGGAVNAQEGSFLEYYDSLLVLGGDNYLADGLSGSVSELLKQYGINAVHARGFSAIIMLIPAELTAVLRKDPQLDMKMLTFSQAANHFAFKSFSNQVAGYVTELTADYLSKHLLKDAHPTVRLMVSKTASASIIATPWLLGVVVDSVKFAGKREKQIWFDSGADFLFSTSITTLKGVTQMGIHHYLDGHKSPNSTEGINSKVDESQVSSELITAGIFAGSWMVLDLASNCAPMPAPMKVVVKQVAKHSLKVSAYGVSGAIKKGSYYTLKSRIGANLINLLTTITMSKLIHMASPMDPGEGFDASALGALQNGFGISSMGSLFELAVDLPALAVEIFLDMSLSYGEALMVWAPFQDKWQ